MGVKNNSKNSRSEEGIELIRKLGRGKYSNVYLGIDSKTNKHVIIKILKPGNFQKFFKKYFQK